MKTLKTLLVLIVLLSLPGKSVTLGPVTTYTFVNPCMAFAVITPVNPFGCYSFSATNAGAYDPNGYYNWDFGDGTTAVGKFVYHCYTPTLTPVNYTVLVAYNSPALCGVMPNYSTYTQTVGQTPTDVCIGKVLDISQAASTATVWGGMAIPEMMFSYNFGDGTPATMTTNVHTYPQCGNYIIEVKSWDMNAPQYPCYSYGAVNIACPENATGIDKVHATNNNLRVFPNPASENVNIISSETINGIKVVDVMGRIVFFQKEVEANTISIPVSEFSSGTYFIKCTYPSGSENNIKFLKE